MWSKLLRPQIFGKSVEVALDILVKEPHVDPIAAGRPAAFILGDILISQTQPVLVVQQMVQIEQSQVLAPSEERTVLNGQPLSRPATQFSLHFTDIHEDSLTLTSGDRYTENPDKLPPFATRLALPASDYYGGSAAIAKHRPTLRALTSPQPLPA
jgi:hypothetical protein